MDHRRPQALAGKSAVWCDYIVVFARDVADKKVKAFVVEKDNPGYKATKIEQKFALRCVQNADIVLTDCRVSEEARLQKCESFADVANVLMGTRNGVAWAAVGNATAAYDIALTYSQRRTQPGRPDCQKPDDSIGPWSKCYGDLHRDATLLHSSRSPDR